MSGLAALLYLDGRPVDPTTLENLASSLTLRGPDGRGCWLDGSVGLVHTMLWTTPESLGERLPFVSSGGDLAITADARIDNRGELLAALGLEREAADSRIILAAYEKWGEDCPERLIGDFAFAIWDRRRHKLFCARDPMGIRPLYYHHAPGVLFACASQVKTLLCLPETPRRLNEVRVLDYLALLFEDQAATFYEEIYRLPAAHCLTVDEGGLRLRRYWDLDASRELRLPSDEDYAEALREVFFEAVRCRLRSAYPVGSFLSGGLDSSSIVCAARRLLPEIAPLYTFSAVFPTLAEKFPRIDERPWIQAVEVRGGLQHHDVACDRLDPLEPFAIFDDDLVPIPNLWLDHAILEEARGAGVRVMLSGEGGDEVISYGQGYLADLARSLRWAALYQELSALAERKHKPRGSVFRAQAVPYLVPQPARRIWRRLHGRPDPLLAFDLPVHPEFASRLGLERRARAQFDLYTPYRGARQNHRMDLLCGFIMHGMSMLDRAGAAFGLEVRLPFYDRRLLELSLAIPARLKLHDGWTRWIFRRAMEGILPPEVQWRPGKGDLSANVRQGLSRSRETLEAVVFGDGCGLETYLEMPRLLAIYRNFLSSPKDSSEGEIFALFTAVTLSLWLRRAGLGVRSSGENLMGKGG